MIQLLNPPTPIEYPESDGNPIAENTRQYECIAVIKGGLDALFHGEPNVFVAGDLLWYPVEGNPKVCQAPDAMVAFNRPKGHRRSYLQWAEGGVAPQVVFEVLSPSNSVVEMARKLAFYERHGVEEYYIYDPDHGELAGYLRDGDRFADVERMQRHVSPRLKVRFELEDGELVLTGPDGKRFLTYADLAADRRRLTTERDAERRRADEQQRRADEQERRADDAERAIAAMRELLREKGIEPPA